MNRNEQTNIHSHNNSSVLPGTTEILDIFNPQAFVFYDVTNPQPALERIQTLQTDEAAYQAVMAEPILAHGAATVNRYFSLSNDLGDGSLMRQIHAMMGLPIV